jgi:hypothetical protein
MTKPSPSSKKAPRLRLNKETLKVLCIKTGVKAGVSAACTGYTGPVHKCITV